jgi:hypothetical protein
VLVARQPSIAVCVVAAALLVAGTAGAALSSTFNVTGVEIAATSTEGTFVGAGSGDGGDTLLWKTVVDHTPLGTNPATPATITGGSLSAESAQDGELTILAGVFTGGSVTYDAARSSTAPCGNQVYDVSGNLALTSDGATGTGRFSVLLTHYRIALFGRCITYGASVTGPQGLTVSI